jgi:hypothetical protein
VKDDPDLKDVLLDAGYELAPVPDTHVSYGCTVCGDPHAETVNGCCIQCAVKDAPRYWVRAPREESEER